MKNMSDSSLGSAWVDSLTIELNLNQLGRISLTTEIDCRQGFTPAHQAIVALQIKFTNNQIILLVRSNFIFLVLLIEYHGS